MKENGEGTLKGRRQQVWNENEMKRLVRRELEQRA